jgi:hypothetical protein
MDLWVLESLETLYHLICRVNLLDFFPKNSFPLYSYKKSIQYKYPNFLFYGYRIIVPQDHAWCFGVLLILHYSFKENDSTPQRDSATWIAFFGIFMRSTMFCYIPILCLLFLLSWNAAMLQKKSAKYPASTFFLRDIRRSLWQDWFCYNIITFSYEVSGDSPVRLCVLIFPLCVILLSSLFVGEPFSCIEAKVGAFFCLIIAKVRFKTKKDKTSNHTGQNNLIKWRSWEF